MSRRLVACATGLLLACGARTEPGEAGSGGGGIPADGGGSVDAVAGDAVAGDAAGGDALVETGPPCPDGGPLEAVYALDGATILYRYDPRTGKAVELGTLDCGNSNVPWTMTATTGRAYVVYTDWSLYAVDLATLACTPTAFQPGQLGLDDEFGVAAYGSGASERIFYYGVPTGASRAILAVSDTVSFAMTKVGDVASPAGGASFPVNLTADEAGHLYAFSPLGLVQEIDSTNAAVLRSVDTGVISHSTWATIAYGSAL